MFKLQLENYFEIDKRALRVFRVLLGLLLLYDLAQRCSDLPAFYSEGGVLPSPHLMRSYWPQGNWSLLTFSNSITITKVLFTIALASAFFFLVGFKGRLMAVICWITLVSIQNRNPLIYQGGDDLLRLLLFWSIFLPLARKNGQKASLKTINDVATMAILLQVLFALFFSGLFKGEEEWWSKGSAIYYALSLDQITRSPGLWLAQHYKLSAVLTRFIFLLEISLLPIFLLPFHRDNIRIFVAAMLLIFAIGISFSMMIGIFPLCFLVASVLFVPSKYWEVIWPSLPGTDKAVIGHQPGQSILLFVMKTFSLGFVFGAIVLWNIASLPDSIISFPRSLVKFSRSVKLDQSWGMFAPTVLKEDGWLIARAELNDGRLVDLNSDDGVLSYKKPECVLNKFKNDRWRKLTEQLYARGDQTTREAFSRFLKNKWDARHRLQQHKVKSVELIMMLEVTQPYERRYETHLSPVVLYRMKESRKYI